MEGYLQRERVREDEIDSEQESSGMERKTERDAEKD